MATDIAVINTEQVTEENMADIQVIISQQEQEPVFENETDLASPARLPLAALGPPQAHLALGSVERLYLGPEVFKRLYL